MLREGGGARATATVYAQNVAAVQVLSVGKTHAYSHEARRTNKGLPASPLTSGT